MYVWIVVASALVVTCWYWRHRRNQDQAVIGQRSVETVSIIIPALNEANTLSQTLESGMQWLQRLQPPAHEIIVVDGNSEDSTAQVAQATGATVVSSQRGRAIQMNAGAAKASGDMLCFVHADSRPPQALVRIMRSTLADPMTVLAGFRTLIERRDGSLLRFMTIHHLLKSYYLVMVARPLMWLGGGLALFGDQSLFCRTADFEQAGGYDESLPIMEDVQLCIRYAGRTAACMKGGHRLPGNSGGIGMVGSCRGQILWPPAHTSGRRLEALGNWKATKIHFTIGLGWYLGISRERLIRLYRTLYADSFR